MKIAPSRVMRMTTLPVMSSTSSCVIFPMRCWSAKADPSAAASSTDACAADDDREEEEEDDDDEKRMRIRFVAESFDSSFFSSFFSASFFAVAPSFDDVGGGDEATARGFTSRRAVL